MKQFDRTIKLVGEENFERIRKAHIAVFGIGGVGGYAVEALVRAGVGRIDIVDSDTVDITNLNRQIIALHSTAGKSKVRVFEERIKDINPQCIVNAYEMFFLPGNAHVFDFESYDYVIDAVDTVAAKIELAVKCSESGTRIISSMGTGNKVHPEMFEIADIFETEIDPLAKVMRKELRKRGITRMTCVYSKEKPVKTESRTPSSISFTPPVAGMILASKVISDIMCDEL